MSQGGLEAGMGHSQAEKAQTHARIIKTASKAFRAKGLDGIGVADLMKAAGTSAGGFYKHFASREELVSEAVEASFGAFDERLKRGVTTGQPWTFNDLVVDYLGVAHRDNAGDGCPFASLAPDLARSDSRTRSVATEQLAHALEMIATLLGDKEQARTEAIVAYAAMIGAVILARLANDENLSREILERTQTALTQSARHGKPADAPSTASPHARGKSRTSKH
jgi:TetR/AcrR family transcriptional repressor of nem operon